jgi:hypothetical protein
MNIISIIIGRLRTHFARKTAPTAIVAPTPFADRAQAARLHNVLLLLFPPPALEMTAYDDFYPMLLYGLRAIPDGGSRFVDDMMAFREKLAACVPADEQTPYDGQAVHDLMLAHIGLLRTVREALSLPAGQFNRMAQGNLSLLPTRPAHHSVCQHLQDNTRFDPRYHHEGVEELVRVIGMLEDEARLRQHMPQQAGLTLRLPD